MAMAGGDGMPKPDHAETNCNNCSVLYSADVLVPTKCGAGYCKSMGKGGVMDLESLRNGESDDGTGDLHQPLLENSKASIVQMKAGSSDFNWKAAVLPFLFPAIGGLLYGYDTGATSGAAVSLTDQHLSGTDWYNLTALETGLFVSGSLYGALLGSLLAFKIADFLGRRLELITAAGFYISGSLISAAAQSLGLLLTGRLVFGTGIGLAMHAVPMYIAETSPPPIRGTLISLKEAFVVGGMLIGYFVASLSIQQMCGWRIMLGLGAPIGLVMGIGVWWLPPSPRWLLLKALQGHVNNIAEMKLNAAAALKRLRRIESCTLVTDTAVEAEVEDTWLALQLACEGNKSQIVTFKELFQGASLKALGIGTGLVFFQQVTGQPSVLYYAAPILQTAGFSVAADATRAAFILSFFKLFMTCVAVVKVDKVGRRPLLIGGVCGVVLSLILLAGYFTIGKMPWLAVAALLLYVGSYQVSFGPISWLMISEIFPLRTRGQALSLTVFVNFLANAGVALAFSPLQEALGQTYTFIIFGIMGLFSLVFILVAVPETKGLSLEQIEAKLLART